MKRILFILLVCLLSLSFFYLPYTSAEVINGEDDGQIDEGLQAFTCQVENESGTVIPVNGNIKVSNPWTGAVYGYWIYSSGTTWTSYTPMAILYGGTGQPNKMELCSLSIPGGYSGGTSTPFAITDWAGITKYGYVLIYIKTNTTSTAVCGPYKLVQ